ncbi:54S ribosomal protein img2, mitochondrial [Neodidymelliopsis sp. IMI 364377]|nr:54S ribosomal protein img2, mitochondrial [Neodidymelliopsis sp. IMI 364377]
MSRIRTAMPLFRAFAAPRLTATTTTTTSTTYRAALRYSTTTTTTTTTTTPSPPPPSRAAALAAAEAITESDSAQPSAIDPLRPAHPSSTSTSKSKHLKTTSRSKSVPFTPATQPSIPLSPPLYHVARSAAKNLPIYTDYKRGGNLHLTTVRKVTGDGAALRDELRSWLGKRDEEVRLNDLTGHVVVKGHCTARVKEFLQARGM